MSKLYTFIVSVFLALGATFTTAQAADYCHDPEDPQGPGSSLITPAIPNDSIVDNVAFQYAIDQAKTDGYPVCVGPGVFDFSSNSYRTDLGNPRRLYALVATGGSHSVTVRGSGAYATVLRAFGDWLGSDQYLIGAYSQRGFFLENVRMDGSGRYTGWAEQQHLVHFGYGATNFGVRNVSFWHPQLAPGGGGDCIRMLGGYNDAELVTDGEISNVWGEFCDRSLISFQRSVRRVNIFNATCYGSGDQCLDMEATGIINDDQLIQDVWIRGYTGFGHGATDVSLGRAIGVRFESSHVYNGTVLVQSCRECSMRDTTILGPDATVPALNIRRLSHGFLMENMHITKKTGSLKGHLVDITTLIEGTTVSQPVRVRIENSYFYQPHDEVAIASFSAEVAVRNSIIEIAPSVTTYLPNAVAITSYRNVASHSPKLVVDGNDFRGNWNVLTKLGGGAGRTRFVGNESDKAKTGLLCEGTMNGIVTRYGNSLEKSPGVPAADSCPVAVSSF